MKNTILVALLSSCFIQPAIAGHVLPTFSGYWYDSCLDARRDTCNQLHCNVYHYIMRSEKDLASILLQDSPQRPECKWGDVYFGHKGSAQPYDFPGYDGDWEEVQKANPDFTTRIWQRDCIDSSSKTIAQASTIIYPSYQCPFGSRFAMYDRETGPIYDSFGGCASKPYLCTIDIVGRDMLSNGALGHVGMIVTSHNGEKNFVPQILLEVLNEKQVIQTNTLENFKAASINYWGAKYGLPNIPYIDRTQELFIYNTSIGKDLGGCRNIEYDLRPSKLHPCQFDPEKGYNVAVLRCDYFVYMSYLGAQIKILDNFDLTTTPAKLFDTLLNFRIEDEAISDHQKIINASHLELEQLQRRLQHASWLPGEHYIEHIFSQPYFDLYSAQLAENTYLQVNSLESNAEKARFLWYLALKHQSDKDKFSYLVSAVTDLRSLELADTIIDEYYHQTDIDNKLTLLQNIGYLHIKNTAATARIEALFKDILLHERNLEILSKAIMMLSSPSAEEKMSLINQALSRLDIGDDLKKRMFLIKGFYIDQLEIILSNQTLQKKYLKNFFDDVVRNGNPQLLNAALYNMFAAFESTFSYEGQPGIFDPAKLENSIRPVLLDYLEKNRPQSPKINLYKFPDFAADYEYYQWLRTYFVVQSKTLGESEKKIAQYVKNIDVFVFKLAMFLCLDRSIYKTQFSIAELSDILQNMQIKLDTIRKQMQKTNQLAEDIYLDAAIEKIKQQINYQKFTHPKRMKIFMKGKTIEVEEN